MHFTPLLLALTASTAAAGPLFVAKTVDDKITIGYGLAIGDVDGDKKPDILLADAKEIVWYHNPDWKKTVIAKNLTKRDNVCIAARDLDGDGKVEIAVGAQWNPGETTNEAESGALFYLQRPEKPDGEWKPVELPHEPTTHRMHWVRWSPKNFALVVLPLHGRGNVNGAGAGVKVIAYLFPDKPGDPAAWKQTVIDDKMHITHNFDVRRTDGPDDLIIGGKEKLLPVTGLPAGWGPDWNKSELSIVEAGGGPVFGGAGEVRFGPDAGKEHNTLCCIEPFHGPNLSLLELDATTRSWKRTVLDTTFNQGHALATGNVMGLSRPQIIAGWREPNAAKEFGIRIYQEDAGKWKSDWVCTPNSMACEDLKVADLDGDGKPEIIAAGRATKNVVIYSFPPRN
jgi:hypothetical protein